MSKLILDLDGTLINEDAAGFGGKLIFRPHLKFFLHRVFSMFEEVAIFSAADKDWVNYVVMHITEFLPANAKFTFIWDGTKCNRKVQREELYSSMFNPRFTTIKSLRKVWESFPTWNVCNTLIIDNSKECFCQNYGNGICIPTFESSDFEVDDCLIRIVRFIEDNCIQTTENQKTNITCIEKRHWMDWCLQNESVYKNIFTYQDVELLRNGNQTNNNEINSN